MTPDVKAAFGKRFENMSAEAPQAKAARLRALIGKVRRLEHAMRNTIAARDESPDDDDIDAYGGSMRRGMRGFTGGYR